MKKSSLNLRDEPTLQDIQNYVRDLKKERGFKNTVQEECLLLGEEIGELFKAIRKFNGMRVDAKSKVGVIDEELADILIYVCAIANQLDIDLETAFRAKEEINKQRSWKSVELL